ncbi:hypothetical protein BsWGS_22559 [Bradybaena similaris]
MLDTNIRAVLFLITTVAVYVPAESSIGYPVVLIPGDGGSQLVAKLNKTSTPHHLCRKYTADYESIWVNLEELLPQVIDCFVDNMRLRYDPVTRTTHDGPGVDIRTTGFGDTASVEYLDPEPATHYLSKMTYFSHIVADLVALGYTRNVSVRGAPFDFRRAPNELGQYFMDLQQLIEDTYASNNNTKVVVIGHSMGNTVFLYFLNHLPQSWKDKFIQSFISLAGVWGGAVKTLRLMASGDNLGVVVVNVNKIRPEQRAMPSTAFLLPSDQFWNQSEVLVITPERNYTVSDYKQYFTDLNFTDGFNMWMDTKNLVHDLTPPEVPVHCLHGSGVPTLETLVFGKGQFPDTYPASVNGDGDGTVNLRSLLGCLRWVGAQKYPVMHVVFNGNTSEHMALLANADVRQYIKNVVMGKK